MLFVRESITVMLSILVLKVMAIKLRLRGGSAVALFCSLGGIIFCVEVGIGLIWDYVNPNRFLYVIRKVRVMVS